MIRAQSCDVSQCRQRDIVRKMFLDVLRHFLLLPAGQAAANRPLGEAGTVVETQKLVHEHDAQRLYVLLLPRAWIDRLRFELERGLPQVVVEEEEPWRELAFGETQRGVDQRSAWIDVEIGDACQLARLVPGGEPVTGGNEAQCPAELLERGARQSLHQRLAVVPLGALAHDQQMARCPEAGLERLTPDDFDGVGPDSIPCRDLTARDIRGGKLYDGPENGRRNGGRFAHDEGAGSSRSGCPP